MATGGDLNTSLSDYVLRAAGMPSGLLGVYNRLESYNNQDLK